MTREQLANILLSDKTKLKEEVMLEDMEYDQFYDVSNIETTKVHVVNNGKVILKENNEWVNKNGVCRLYDIFKEKQVTIIR